ncbi:hypothetical protein BDY24DRAFT_443656 [Mrakia frigida]|uniref:uncharacterized protein n=1 Tax=Mrakia frigida TaxID=29902 RepID=UPI003FCC0B63
MSTTSSICIPLEILHEFILHSSSSSSTLAAWCLVSQSLLSFAGPLLYRTVSLKRSEDILPFLARLLHPSRVDSPSLLPFSKVQRLEISALPASEDIDQLLSYGTSGSGPSNSIVLPKRYEDLSLSSLEDAVGDFNLEGPVLEIYLSQVDHEFRDFRNSGLSRPRHLSALKHICLECLRAVGSYIDLQGVVASLPVVIALASPHGVEIEPGTPLLVELGKEMLKSSFFADSGSVLGFVEMVERCRTFEATESDLTAAQTSICDGINLFCQLEEKKMSETRAFIEQSQADGRSKSELRKGLEDAGLASMLGF